MDGVDQGRRQFVFLLFGRVFAGSTGTGTHQKNCGVLIRRLRLDVGIGGKKRSTVKKKGDFVGLWIVE